MTVNMPNWLWRGSISAFALLLLCTTVWAAGARRTVKGAPYNPADATVEMFAAIEKGDISVKLIPDDSRSAHVLIENKTDKPLNVKLPEAFAGVPALAQQNGRTTGNNSNNNSNQSTGGGMGMGGMGGGMGMFNVPPERVGKLDVATVCLEHGKREPNARIPYDIKPLDSLTSKPGVRELCEMLGNGQLNQRAAQAAAWHLNNGMSWQELAAKTIHRANGARTPYFSAAELQAAMRIADTAVRAAEEKKQKQDTGTSRSEK